MESDISRSTFEGPRRPRALGRPRDLVAAALLIPFVVWFEFWLFGWQPGSFGPKVMALTPWVAWASLVPLVAALVLRAWPVALVASVVAFVFATTILAPRLLNGPRGDVARDGAALRVMSSNLYVGRADPDAFVDSVRSRRIDVLSLVELPPDELARLDRAGLRALLPYRVLNGRAGADGSGLFSRYPLRNLPPSSPADRGGEPHGLVAVPGAVALDVQVVHPLPPIDGWKERWHDALAALPAVDPRDGHAHLLVGDFNATVDHPELRRLLGFIHDGDFEPDNAGYDDAADRAGKGLVMTWPADRRYPPVIAIDHVLVDQRVGVASFDADRVKGSDHRAVLATVRIPRRL